MTGRVMVRNSLKDSFVFQVRHPFTSLNSLFCLLFPLSCVFVSLSSLVDTLVLTSPAEVINLNHSNDICLGLALKKHLWPRSTCVWTES